jgi:maleate cis-trans isomerase
VLATARGFLDYFGGLSGYENEKRRSRMSYAWRGTVGFIKPTYRVGTLEEMMRLLPEGIGFIPLHVGIKVGTENEFTQSVEVVERRVERLASLDVDLILVDGAPLPMLLGREAEQSLAKRLSEKSGVPVIFPATTGLFEALKALSAKSIVGVTYFGDDQNRKFAGYLEDEGFKVCAMAGMETPFKDVGKIQATDVYSFAKKTFLDSGGGDVIYLLGAGWRVLSIIDPLERDLGIKVITNIPITLWYILKTLRVKEPIPGCGQLLRDHV